ncbi:MAG TPA: thiamine biosynthesis protein ThiS [Candidatus Atribacteria bacterium]|nr:thiamine biosynthesis protein ThiS [Candidatus Atribacteria bacterium]
MKVYLKLRKNEMLNINKRLSVNELLKELNLLPQEVLVIDTKNKKLLTPDKVLSEDMEIEIRGVISGG